MRLKDPLKSKQLRQGRCSELAEEGATQMFFPERNNDIILGAVGVLQFDVVASRLRRNTRSSAPTGRSASGRRAGSRYGDKKQLLRGGEGLRNLAAVDGGGHLTYLAPTQANLSLMEERWPDVKFRATREHHFRDKRPAMPGVSVAARCTGSVPLPAERSARVA